MFVLQEEKMSDDVMDIGPPCPWSDAFKRRRGDGGQEQQEDDNK